MKTKDKILTEKLDIIAETSEKLRASGWPDKRDLRPALGSRVLTQPVDLKGGK